MKDTFSVQKEYYKPELIEKELDILRNAIDEANQKKKTKMISSPIIKKIVYIVEKFLKQNDFVCYGGTAINNILPTFEQFYDKSVDIPDYDFFSPDAINDAKRLADIYYENGFEEVEAKAGVHPGTYKVFVNFIPIADITQIAPELYDAILKDSIDIKRIYYAPPNFLRMSAYLELSRPTGDTSRWEKVLKRLVLLNKHYPLRAKNCSLKTFIRKFEAPTTKLDTIYNTVKNIVIDMGYVFFGGFAIHSYGKYLGEKERKLLLKYPDFDILAENPELAVDKIIQKLKLSGIKNTKMIKHDEIGEIISTHYEIRVGEDTIAFIYKPLACHSYNIIKLNNKNVKIATIDTMLSLYLAFSYANRPYYDAERILCISQYLFMVQAKNRLDQIGVLKRFSSTCYGKQSTLESIRAYKANKFKELKHDKCSDEYQHFFIRYFPYQKNTCTKTKKHLKKPAEKTAKSKTIKKQLKEKTKKSKTIKKTT
jgi:hypothetical protein